MGLEYFALFFNLYKIGLAVNTEHSHWFVMFNIMLCVSNVLLVYGTVLSIYIIYLYYIIYIYIKYIKHDLFLSLYICFDKDTVL